MSVLARVCLRVLGMPMHPLEGVEAGCRICWRESGVPTKGRGQSKGCTGSQESDKAVVQGGRHSGIYICPEGNLLSVGVLASYALYASTACQDERRVSVATRGLVT